MHPTKAHTAPSRVVLLLAALATGAASVPLQSSAQAPPSDRGAVAVGLLLRQLDGVKRVLMIGAHPDDEDTSTLTTLARGMGARTAYLSVTRGEGGQNLIGPELGEGLGLVRSGELVAARTIDGGEQFFTRAIDFGFSKTADETLGKWPREEILGDVVWVIRRFRPHVILSVFSGTPRDGHGQHQVAGLLTHEAFDVAGDPTRFPEQLANGVEAWQPTKLYRLARRDPSGASASLETGTFDPLLARSYFQVSMDSRSQHRSQDMGAAQPLGPRNAGVTLVKTADGVAGEGGIFAGVDTTLVSLASALAAASASEARETLEAYGAAVAEARTSLDAFAPERSAPALARALVAVDEVIGLIGNDDATSELARVLTRRRTLVQRALLAASAVVMSVRTNDDLIVPGEDLEVRVDLWNAGPYRLTGAGPAMLLPDGWTADLLEGRTIVGGGFGPFRSSTETVSGTAETLGPGEIRRWAFRVRVPADAQPSRLYYQREQRSGEYYEWPAEWDLRGLPRDRPLLSGRVRFDLDLGADISGSRVAVEEDRAARYYGVDPTQGEFTKPLLVVPAASVMVEPDLMAWPLGSTEERTVSIRVRNQAEAGFEGTLTLAGSGWSVDPATTRVELGAPGAERAYSIGVRPSADMDPGMQRLRAVVRTDDGRSWSERFDLIDYPHIERVAQFHAAELRASIFPVAVDEGLWVGYVMGSGDSGPAALTALGVDVEVLQPSDVLAGDFGRFDALVLGVRAYETRPDLAAANDAVLDFAHAGGTVVVQYNQYNFPSGDYAPYPVTISRPHDRITDETASVTPIEPEAPVLTTPNRITDADFEGWVQERGLYFLGTWDPAFTPVLSMADPGEAPKEGSLLVASVGQGVYVYTGLAFFRQFPAGVPGAYRLFANLVSLDGAAWRDYREGAENR